MEDSYIYLASQKNKLESRFEYDAYLQSLKDSALQKIIFLSNLNSKCNEAIEICIFNIFREKAVILRLKKEYILSKLANYREFIQLIDERQDQQNDFDFSDLQKFKEVQVSCELLADDFVKILKSDENCEHLKILEDNLAKEGINKAETMTSDLIENMMQNSISKTTKFKNRRKYNRRFHINLALYK